jgi:hypothetical protein
MPDSDGFTRRELLAFLPTGALGWWVLQNNPVGDTYFAVTSIRSEGRTERLRPIPGGVGVGLEENLLGTLGVGVKGPNGEDAMLTNRHLFGASFCSGGVDQLIGTEVFQPYRVDRDDEGRIGEVIDAGETGGLSSTDWALIELDQSNWWTDKILGLGPVGSSTSPTVGDRIAMSGLRSGLLGGELEETSVSRRSFGCHFDNLLRYSVDGGVETSGNSGSIVGHLDSSGVFRPIGIHSFSDDQGLYAIPITDVTEQGVSFGSSSTTPAVPDTISRVEGTVISWDSSNDTATIHLGNVGGETATRSIETRHTDGDTVDTQEITLDPLQTTQIEMLAPSSVILDTGDTTRLIDL